MDAHVDVSSTLFAAVLGQNADTNTLSSVLRALSELQILQTSSKALEDWIGRVNNALNSRKTRLEALCLLGLIVDQSASEVFSQHCMSWLRLLLQVLQSHNTVKTLQLACSVMAQVLQQVTRFPEMSREVSTEVIPSLILCLLKESDEWLVSAFQLLSACMRYFSGPCGPFKSKLEDKILPALSNFNAVISKAASLCYPLLATIGGGGNSGIKHTEAWSHYFDRLLVSAHNILAILFEGLESESYFLPPSDSISIPDVADIEPSRTLHLTQHFDVLSSCISNMLQGPFAVVARIPLHEVVSLCCRCFMVQPFKLPGRKSTEHCSLMANLYILQRAALDILGSLIGSCHSNLIPEGHAINQLLVQSLKSTNSEAIISQKPYSALRTKTYTVLEKWITELGIATGIVNDAERLIDFIIQDCTSPTNSTGSSVRGQGFSNQQKVNLSVNSGICEAGLKVLRMMLLSCQLSPPQHKIIHEFAVSHLLKIHQQIQELPAPYGSQTCRKELYHVLLAQVLAPHPRWPPSLHCAVQLFRFGRRDPSSLVAGFCIEASITCTSLMHPRVPSLHSRLPVAELQNESSLQSRLPEDVGKGLEIFESRNTDADIVEGSIMNKEIERNGADVQKRVCTDESDISDTVGGKRRKHDETRHEVIEKPQEGTDMVGKLDIEDVEDDVEDASKINRFENTKQSDDTTDNNTQRYELGSFGNQFKEQISTEQTDQPVGKSVPEKKEDVGSDDDDLEMFTSFVDIPASDTNN